MGKRYTEEFKAEAIKQVTERGRSVAEVTRALGVSVDSMYAWLRTHRKTRPERQAEAAEQSEVRRLQAELRRVTEERDILKKAAAYFAKQHG
jgi:transposase